MNTRGWLIAAWLVVGHAILGALYWGLLQIPEANVLMLTASLVTVLVMVAWAGTVEAVGVIGWAHGGGIAAVIASGARRSAWIVPALAVFLVVWLAAGFAGNWLVAHRGELDAWFIAKFGWTGTGWVHATLAWVVWLVQYGVGLSAAVACLAAGVLRGAGGVVRFSWLTRGLHWKALLITAAAMATGVYLPWRYVVFWRPESVPPTAAQPAFAAVKLALVYIVMNAAWLVVLWWAARPIAKPAAAAPKEPAPAEDNPIIAIPE